MRVSPPALLADSPELTCHWQQESNGCFLFLLPQEQKKPSPEPEKEAMKLSDKGPAANKESDLEEKKSVSPGSLTSSRSAWGLRGCPSLPLPPRGHAGYRGQARGQRLHAG